KEVVGHVFNQVRTKYPDSGISLSANIPDVNFNQFALDKVNGLFALQQIKDSYNLTVYFRNKELYAGLAYGQQFGEVNYSLTHNVIDHDLTYRNEEDVLLKVKAVGIKRDNTKTDVEVGD